VISLAVLVGVTFTGAYLILRDDRVTIKVSGAYALDTLMTIWAKQYHGADPDVRIEVSGGGAGKGMTDVLSGVVDIAMVSREIHPQERAKGAHPVPVCIDAVVATVSEDNPVLPALERTGVTKDKLGQVFVTRSIRTWGELVGDPGNDDPINVYTRADACGAASTWAAYLGNHTQDDLTRGSDVAIMHDPDLARAVSQDPFGIGYNNLNFAYDMSSGHPVEGLRVLPLDHDGDGSLGPNGSFYRSRDALVEAIGDGRYPSPPARDLYLVAKGSFRGASLDFVLWILDEGQSYVESGGYLRLSEQVLSQQRSLLYSGEGRAPS